MLMLLLTHRLIRSSFAAGERNIADQRLLEQELYTSHGIQVERMTLKEVSKYAYHKDGSKLLYIKTNDGLLHTYKFSYS